MIGKRIGEIAASDVRALLGERMEDRTIDFKQALPGGSDNDKKEFLADVSAFANANGGDVLFGVEEREGLAVDAPGVAVDNFDDLRLRLQNTMSSGLNPRLPLVEVEQVTGFPNGSVVIVRVQQSWRAPHMVTFRGSSKFYYRDNGQRHEMDVTELRAAFGGQVALAERVRAFRDGRYGLVLIGESPVRSVPAVPVLAIHVIPFGLAFDRSDVDVRSIRNEWRSLNLRGPSEMVYAPFERPNLDGLVIASSLYMERYAMTPSYLQVFRNGGVEFVQALAETDGSTKTFVAHPLIDGEYIERTIFDIVKNARKFHRQVGVGGPVVVTAALLRVRAVPFVRTSRRPTSNQPTALDRANVVLPEVLIDDSATDLPSSLRPLIDSLWQAGGYSGSSNYDVDGNYHEPQW